MTKLALWTRAVAPYLLCFALCVVAANAQDFREYNIKQNGHKFKDILLAIGYDGGYIVIIAGLVIAWMRRSLRTGLGAIMVGAALMLTASSWPR